MTPLMRALLTGVILLGLCASWVCMSETLTTVQVRRSALLQAPPPRQPVAPRAPETWVITRQCPHSFPQVGFRKPFFITYFVHVCYGVLLPFGLASAWYRVSTGRAKFAWREAMCCGERGGRAAYGYGIEAVKGPPPLFPSPVSVLLVLGAGLTFLIIGVAYTWYMSLPLTSVPANNAIYQSCSAAVFVFSVVALGERATWRKIIAVGISLGGIVLVALGGTSSDATDSTPEPLGYVLVVVSVLTYALYEVLYARFGEAAYACKGAPGLSAGHGDEEDEEGDEDGACSDAEGDDASTLSGPLAAESASLSDPGVPPRRGSGALEAAAARLGAWAAPPEDLWSQTELSLLMMGGFGVFTLVLVWPFFPLLDATGVEPFVWPVPAGKWPLLVLNAALDTVYNALLLLGILVAGPLVISVGVMLVVPASMVVDGLLNSTVFHPVAVVGVVCIVLGFVVLKAPVALIRPCLGALGLAARPGKAPLLGPRRNSLDRPLVALDKAGI